MGLFFSYSFQKSKKTHGIGIKNIEIRYKRGVACRRCNTLMQEKTMGAIPLFFHNSMGFDSHLLLKHFPASATGQSQKMSHFKKHKKLNTLYSETTRLFRLKLWLQGVLTRAHAVLTGYKSRTFFGNGLYRQIKWYTYF